MAVIYVTYVQNGVKKKGSIKESQYEVLKNSPNVSDLTVYPNARLMEQAVGGNDKKRLLHD